MAAAQAVTVTDLRVEYMINPLGIDVREPSLSWRMKSTTPAEKQTAYQVHSATASGQRYREQHSAPRVRTVERRRI